MVGGHSSSSAGLADKTRDDVRDRLRPLFSNVRVSKNVMISAQACGAAC